MSVASVAGVALVASLAACDLVRSGTLDDVGTVAVTGVWLDQHALSLAAVSSTAVLVATVTPADATNKSLTWSSSDARVARVSQRGELAVVGTGTATITVTTQDGGFADACSVTVTDRTDVTGVSLDHGTLSMTPGSSVALVATVTPWDATNTSVVWSSTNTSVALVSPSGEVKALAAGVAVITATTIDRGFSDTCVVTVTTQKAPTRVSLDREVLRLTVGESGETLMATVAPPDASKAELLWSSNDPRVATVSQNGLVSPVAAGNAMITVTTVDGGLTDSCAVVVVGELETVAWVLSYFGPNYDPESDSLHLAYSTDGLHWRALNRGAPVFRLAGMGANQIRDPFILRKQDGTFVTIATDWTRDDEPGYWDNPSPEIVVADSVDLITFTNPRRLQVTNLPGVNGRDMHAWAPEAYWEADLGKYAILFSGNDATGANRIYVSYTDDFETVDDPTPTVFFDPGYSAIDATVTPANDRNYLLFKDEVRNDIQIARSSGAVLSPGSFVRWDADFITRGTAQNTEQTTEGPFIIQIPGESRWYMFADYYTQGGTLGCWTTTDLDSDASQWSRLSSAEYRFPPGVRHANTVRVTRAELDALVGHYGGSWLVRTTLTEAAEQLYFAHSWYHGVTTNLQDRANGLLDSDFYWRIVPGLADPSDPDLVSFEPVNFSGRYVRIDSQNPDRYPACDSTASRAETLCDVPSGERHHLVWIDAYEDSDIFRADATFRRVAALSGDPTMVSFQWYQESTRYLCPVSFQMFAYPVAEQEHGVSSFSIE